MDRTAVDQAQLPPASEPGSDAREQRRETPFDDQLCVSRDYPAAILEAVGDGITVCDATGRMIYADKMAAAGAGKPPREALIATPTSEALARYDVLDEDGNPLPAHAVPRDKVLRGEGADRTLLRFRDRQTGVERWYVLSATPVRDADGRLQQVVSVYRDVTAQHAVRRQREERARQQATLLELTRLALVDDDLDELLDAAGRLIVEALRVEVALVAELSSDGRSFLRARRP